MGSVALPPEDHKAIFDWVNGRKNMLIIYGPPGTGKTYLCAALCNYVFDKFRFIRVFQDRKFMSRIRDSIDEKGDYMDNMKYLCDDDLVIIDDFGSDGFTDWRKSIWQAFLDIRYQSEKPTIITTNLTKEEIRKEFPERFPDRLFSKENTIIEMNGKNYRKPENLSN